MCLGVNLLWGAGGRQREPAEVGLRHPGQSRCGAARTASRTSAPLAQTCSHLSVLARVPQAPSGRLAPFPWRWTLQTTMCAAHSSLSPSCA